MNSLLVIGGSSFEMEEEINLIDYWRVLVKWKRTIALVVIAGTLSAVIYSLNVAETFKAEATIMLMERPRGGGITSNALASVSGFLKMGDKSSSGQLLAILKSRTLAEKMIEKYGLMKVFYPEAESGKGPTMEDAVSTFFGQISFVDDDQSQLIIIRVVTKDPTLAASMANRYLEELTDHINENTFTTAKRDRIFIEEQLERNKAELLESGRELTTFYVTNRVSSVVPTMNVDVSIGTRGDGQEMIGDKWAEAKKKTDGFQKQVENLKAKIEKVKVVQGVPQQVYLQYLTLQGQLLGQVNGFLTQQYEMAKIEETKQDINFQVIDWARVPERKFKPERKKIVMLSFVMAVFLAIFYVFFREYLEKINKTKSLKITQK